MVKRAFRDHRFAISLIGLNTFIVVEEFARLYLSHPKFIGLGWYWTAILSFPSSILWWLVPWPWPSDFLCMLALVGVGAFQWGIIGAAFDHWSRSRHSAANT